ncbi:MAG: RluA family pseudouridine synthase [Bacteroidales bacterium]|nr:RluA family pseudouridine synthase [Bacteroidales bacterium]
MDLEKDIEREEEQELYEHHRIVVDPGQNPERIDKFLFNRIINVSRNKIQQAAKAGSILVNQETAKSNYKVKPNDVITVVLSHPPRITDILPEDIPLEIVYEDTDVIVVNKPAGMVVHPAYANFDGTLLNALAGYFKKNKSTEVENGFGYLVHRIDKDTSGLLLVAKNEMAQTILAKQFFDHSVERIYHALVWGDLENDEGTIEGNIGRHPKDRRKMIVFQDESIGKHAITHYKVLERFGYVTLVACRLETGRTHQIRAHFRYLGHPLFNDEKYGGSEIVKGTTFTKYKQFVQNCFKIIPRQSLHAKTLGFTHPINKKNLHFDSIVPEDLQAVLEKWRNYALHKEIEEE